MTDYNHPKQIILNDFARELLRLAQSGKAPQEGDCIAGIRMAGIFAAEPLSDGWRIDMLAKTVSALRGLQTHKWPRAVHEIAPELCPAWRDPLDLWVQTSDRNYSLYEKQAELSESPEWYADIQWAQMELVAGWTNALLSELERLTAPPKSGNRVTARGDLTDSIEEYYLEGRKADSGSERDFHFCVWRDRQTGDVHGFLTSGTYSDARERSLTPAMARKAWAYAYANENPGR